MELSADLFRWFFIYLLCPRVTKLEDFAIVGFVAGVFAQLVRERKDKEIADDILKASQESVRSRRSRGLKIDTISSPTLLSKLGQQMKFTTKESSKLPAEIKQLPRPRRTEKVDFVVTRFARAGVECAVQLLTYEASRRYSTTLFFAGFTFLT